MQKLTDEQLAEESKRLLDDECYMEWVRRGKIPVELARMFGEKRRKDAPKFRFL
jgi:hypothetical protein